MISVHEAKVMLPPNQIQEDTEAVAKKERFNVVLEDNPARWMITVTKVPVNTNVGLLTETIIIETEPSLWFRSEKWQEFEVVEVSSDAEDEAGLPLREIKSVPIYEMALILMVHYIGS